MPVSNNNNSLEMILHLYAKKVQPLVSRDPSYIQKLIERLNNLMEERPQLKEVFRYSLKFNTIVFDIAKAFAKLDKALQIPTKVDKKLVNIITTSKRIVLLNANVLNLIKAFVNHTKVYALPEVLAYEDVLAHSLLTKNELSKVIEQYKQELKYIKESYKKLRPALVDLKNKLQKRLQEGWGILRDILNRALNILYGLYKRLANFVLKVHNIIVSRYNTLAEKAINAIAGNDPKLQILLSALFPIATGLAYKKLFAASFFGPIAGIMTIASVIQQIASMEVTVSEIAQSLVNTISELDAMFEKLDLDIEE